MNYETLDILYVFNNGSILDHYCLIFNSNDLSLATYLTSNTFYIMEYLSDLSVSSVEKSDYLQIRKLDNAIESYKKAGYSLQILKCKKEGIDTNKMRNSLNEFYSSIFETRSFFNPFRLVSPLSSYQRHLLNDKEEVYSNLNQVFPEELKVMEGKEFLNRFIESLYQDLGKDINLDSFEQVIDIRDCLVGLKKKSLKDSSEANSTKKEENQLSKGVCQETVYKRPVLNLPDLKTSSLYNYDNIEEININPDKQLWENRKKHYDNKINIELSNSL